MKEISNENNTIIRVFDCVELKELYTSYSKYAQKPYLVEDILLLTLQRSEFIDESYTIRRRVVLNMYSVSARTSSSSLKSSDVVFEQPQVTTLRPICGIDIIGIVSAYKEWTHSHIHIALLDSHMVMVVSDDSGLNAMVFVIRIGTHYYLHMYHT